jgi:hypothetical protein
LPESVYIKCGCRIKARQARPVFPSSRPGKTYIESAATNQHILVESNTLAKSACGDMIIFIDGSREKQISAMTLNPSLNGAH